MPRETAKLGGGSAARGRLQHDWTFRGTGWRGPWPRQANPFLLSSAPLMLAMASRFSRRSTVGLTSAALQNCFLPRLSSCSEANQSYYHTLTRIKMRERAACCGGHWHWRCVFFNHFDGDSLASNRLLWSCPQWLSIGVGGSSSIGSVRLARRRILEAGLYWNSGSWNAVGADTLVTCVRCTNAKFTIADQPYRKIMPRS